MSAGTAPSITEAEGLVQRRDDGVPARDVRVYCDGNLGGRQLSDHNAIGGASVEGLSALTDREIARAGPDGGNVRASYGGACRQIRLKEVMQRDHDGRREISRRPEDVFSYVADPSHHPEWIDSVVSARREDDGPLAVGSKVLATRRVGPWKVRITERMDELHPPRTWANHGVGGIPVIAFAKGTIEPLDDGKRSRVTISCEFQGRGIGKLLVSLLSRRLAKLLPRDEQKLKKLLERGGAAHASPGAAARLGRLGDSPADRKTSSGS